MQNQIQLYNQVSDNIGRKISISEIIETITGKTNASANIEQRQIKLRQLLSQGNRAEADELKRTFPAVTWSGTFTKRSAKNLEHYTGLVCLDVDKLASGTILQQLRSKVKADPHTYILFTSPSGNGLKIIFRVADTVDQHKEYFLAIEKYFINQFQISIDQSGKDVCRLCFLPYDETLYINAAAEVFTMDLVITEQEQKKLSALPASEKKILQASGQECNDIWESTQQVIQYTEGNRNNFVFKFACNCNRVGITLSECSQFAIGAAHALKANQVESTVKSAYNHNSAEYGKYKRRNNSTKESLSSRNAKNNNQDRINNEIIFYSPIYKSDEAGAQVLKDVKINYVKFIELLYSFGFRRYDIQRDFIYIHLKDNVIKEVSILQIQDYFCNYLESLPDELSNGVTKRNLKEKIYNNPKNYFCDNRLSLLINKQQIIFNADTKRECFIYYKNGFVKCDPDGWHLQGYNKLQGHIWENQIIDREFKFLEIGNLPMNELSPYAQFLNNVCGNDQDRMLSLCSLIGYLLHSYTDVKMKAVILTDSKISEEANGRTGKTLFGQTLKYIKKLTQINGKDFDFTNRYKYQEANLDTQIVFLNDVRSNFKFEVLYNDITEGITVEKKNQNPFTLKTKMCITTNKTIVIEGSSSKDRCIEFEFTNHYSEKFSPEDEFKHRFFSDWDVNAWQQFDNFMMHCICVYLGNGIVQPKNINLDGRKLLDQTHKYFLEFMEEKIKNGVVVVDREICKQDLHTEFLSEYPELKEDKYRNRLETFTKWIKTFAKYSPGLDEDIQERKSNKNRFFTFRAAKG